MNVSVYFKIAYTHNFFVVVVVGFVPFFYIFISHLTASYFSTFSLIGFPAFHFISHSSSLVLFLTRSFFLVVWWAKMCTRLIWKIVHLWFVWRGLVRNMFNYSFSIFNWKQKYSNATKKNGVTTITLSFYSITKKKKKKLLYLWQNFHRK